MEVEGEKNRVLLIEDNPGDARLIRELLSAEERASFFLEHADRLSAGLARLAQGNIDVILLDLSLPDSHGLESINKIYSQVPKLPIVVLSGLSDEAVAINAVQEGAQDYLVKGSVNSALLVRSLRYAIERQHLRVALHESEARYRLLADNAADVIWTANMKWQITYVSPSIKRLLGYTVEEMQRLAIKDMFTPDSLKQATKLIRGQMDIMTPESQYPPLSLTLEHVRKDGSTLWAEVMLSFLWGKDGKLSEVLGVTREITERKKAEEALRESEEEMRAIFDNAGNGIALLDLEGRVIRVNKRVFEVGGYDMEDVSGKPLDLLKMFTPESLERMSHVKDMVLSGKEVTAFECEVCTKSGEKLSLEINAGPFFLKGQLFGLVAVIRDITEHKRMEEALKESEARFRTVFEGTSLSIALVDFNARTLSINPAFEQMLGYNLEEFKQIEGNLKYLYPDDAMVDAKLYIELLKGKREHYTVDKRYIRKDGAVIWGRQNLSVVRDDKGKPKYFIAMVEDITARKKIEEELRQSEEKYRLHFENVSDVIFSFDREFRILSMSPSVKQMLGYSTEELIGKRFTDLNILAPECLELALSNALRTLEGERVGIAEYIFIAKDGSRRYGELSEASPLFADGKVVAVLSAGRDITERKKMEQELLRLSDAVRMSTDSIVITDLEGNVVDVNEATLKIQGASNKSDLIGLKSSDFIAPEEQEKALTDLSRLVEEGCVSDIEYHILTRDGKRVLVETNASLMREENGKPAGIVAITRDITERKRMEDALRQSEHNYRILFEGTIDGMFVTDALTMKVVLANKNAVKMLGFDSVDSTISMNPLDLVHPDDKEQVLQYFMQDASEQSEREIHEFRAITKDGREIWVSGMGTRIEYGDKPAILASVRDITERKRMEEDKGKMEEQLHLAGRLAAVGELASGVAHELNNPIAAIQSFAQFLTARKDLDETLRKDLDTIYRESQRAAKITQNLLSFARRHEPEKHLISINEAIEKTLELQAHPMKVNNIELMLELDPELPKTLADFHQLQQVFMNIMNNAEQAMLEAHGKGRLEVKTQKVGSMIRISFADNGPGIPEENMKRIFDPFFTTKEVGKGTGLGLSICYGLVEAHGGRIYARSKLGQGATFVIEIPVVSENQLVAEAALLKLGSRGVTWKKPRGQY